MSKEELKAALSGLNVNRPLKVATTAPAFKAPVPPVESPPSQVQIEPRVENEPRFKEVNPGSDSTQVQTEPRIERTSGARAATPQDDAVLLQRELHGKLATGYTRLPNALLMSMLAGDLGKNEVRLLLLIARLTISFDREFVKLSKAVVKRYTGMQGRAMLDAFAVLEERKLIRKVTGDHKSPNQYALVAEVTTPGPSPGSKRTQVQSEPQVQNSTQGWVQNEPPRKDILEIYKNSLSQEPAVIREYFARAMPSRKRESELKAFEELKRDYNAQDVADALACLQRGRGGANGTALVYHSPMAYLGKAMGEVMAAVQKHRHERDALAARTAREVEARRQQQAEEAREAALVAEQERAFAKAYPGEAQQREVLAQLLRGTPFKPESRMGRIMALGKWWTPHEAAGINGT